MEKRVQHITVILLLIVITIIISSILKEIKLANIQADNNDRLDDLQNDVIGLQNQIGLVQTVIAEQYTEPLERIRIGYVKDIL